MVPVVLMIGVMAAVGSMNLLERRKINATSLGVKYLTAVATNSILQSNETERNPRVVNKSVSRVYTVS